MPTLCTETLATLATAAALLAHLPAAQAAEAHVHGIAKLDIAVESTRLSVHLDSPLDNLLGFEHAPRTDAERKQVDAAVAKLKDAAAMFRIDPAAQCTPAVVELASAALKLGRPDADEAKPGHADIDASFEFDCVDATKAGYVDVGLFGFSHLQGLEVQGATPAGQFRRDLKRPVVRIRLKR